MSRSYDFTIATVVTLIAFAWHRMAVGFFDPGGALYDTAVDATALNGATRAEFWHAIGVLWMPMIAIGGIWVFVVVREWRRQSISGARRAPR